MLLSNLTQWVGNHLPEKEAVRINAEAGFDAYDISLFQLTRDKEYIFNRDDYVEVAKDLRAYADSLGIVCNQSHAPYPSSTGKEEEEKTIDYYILFHKLSTLKYLRYDYFRGTIFDCMDLLGKEG
mgnify:CR=1 FL=1